MNRATYERPFDMDIYTRTGDAGTTGTARGERISKGSQTVAASGAFDEAITRLGAVVVKLDRVFAGGHAEREGSVEAQMYDIALWLQNRLFTAAACVVDATATPSPISAEDTAIVERMIDALDTDLPLFRDFILPGSTELSIRLDLARTGVRACEREVVALGDHVEVNPLVLSFVNRASDLLYTMARAAAHAFNAPSRPWNMSPEPPTIGRAC